MPSCVVKWCISNADKKRSGITFHRFPSSKIQAEKWVSAVRLERNEPDWMPSKSSRVCSIHFQNEDMYFTDNGKRKRLKKQSTVPICTMVSPANIDSPDDLSTNNANKQGSAMLPPNQPLILVDYPVLFGGTLGYVLTGTKQGLTEAFGPTCHGATVNLGNEGSSGETSSVNMQDQPGPSQSSAPQDFGDGSVSPITDPEDDEVEVKTEPHCGDGEDPLTSQSVEGSTKELQSPPRPNLLQSTDPLQVPYAQPSTSTTPVIKIEIEAKGDYKEEFLKLQQEVETLKAENQSLITRNHNLAREIFNLKQTSHVSRKDDAIKDTHSINNDLLSQLAKESHRLSEKISEYADKIQKITSKYEIGEETMDTDQNDHENLDLTNKFRRLIEDNKNVIDERDKLKEKVQSLLVDLQNVSEENKTLIRNVKLQRRRIEMLRIQCVSKTRNLNRLENSCIKLKSRFSKLKMTRRNF